MKKNRVKRTLCAVLACLTLGSCASFIACEEGTVDGEFTYKTDISDALGLNSNLSLELRNDLESKKIIVFQKDKPDY